MGLFFNTVDKMASYEIFVGFTLISVSVTCSLPLQVTCWTRQPGPSYGSWGWTTPTEQVMGLGPSSTSTKVNILCHTVCLIGSDSTISNSVGCLILFYFQIKGKHLSFKGKTDTCACFYIVVYLVAYSQIFMTYAWFCLVAYSLMVIFCRAVWNQSPSFSG